jgi:hypothetical protein
VNDFLRQQNPGLTGEVHQDDLTSRANMFIAEQGARAGSNLCSDTLMQRST